MASYNQYEEAIARAKAALESYSDQTEALARLYETAKANAQTAYEAQKEQTAAEARESKRHAGIDMQRTERNLDQRLAARGLAFSGENAQTRLDLLVALRNQLAGIDSDERNRLANLDQALADRTHELDMAYAEKRADSAKQLASLNADLAAAEANKAAAEEAAKAAAAAQAAAAASKGNGSADSSKKEKAKAAVELPLQFGENFKNMSKNLMDRFQRKSLKDPAPFIPEVSARTLANQLVKAAGSSGKISGSRQQAKLASMLEELLSSVKLDSAYYGELMLNLRSLGYRPDYAQNADANTAELQNDARDVYDQTYRRHYNLYRNAGEEEGDAARRADADARYQQIRYLYTHSADKEEFDYVIQSLKLHSYLSNFYARLSDEKGKVVLGGDL